MLNVVVIELFAVYCTCSYSCVVQLLPIMPAIILRLALVATTLANSTTGPSFEAMIASIECILSVNREPIMGMNSNCLNPVVCI